jgi:Flp pilus assembly pilin Flp
MVTGPKNKHSMLHALTHRKDGATMIEYAFIASLVALALVGVLSALGVSIAPIFTTVSETL